MISTDSFFIIAIVVVFVFKHLMLAELKNELAGSLCSPVLST